MKNNKISFFNGIAFFTLGVFVFVRPDMVVKLISYFLGGLLIALGIYKTVNYYIQDKRLGVVNRNEFAFGITAIVLGVIFMFLAGAIELLLRFIVGGWLIVGGINRLATTFYTRERDNKFYALLIVGAILIGIGLYIILVSNLALSIIGLFMMIYGLVDFISYFVYKDYSTVKSELKDKKALVVEEAEVTYENDGEDKK